jgi:hypothetical protein
MHFAWPVKHRKAIVLYRSCQSAMADTRLQSPKQWLLHARHGESGEEIASVHS